MPMFSSSRRQPIVTCARDFSYVEILFPGADNSVKVHRDSSSHVESPLQLAPPADFAAYDESSVDYS